MGSVSRRAEASERWGTEDMSSYFAAWRRVGVTVVGAVVEDRWDSVNALRSITH